MQIIVTYGVQNRLQQDFPAGTVVREVLTDPDLQAALGYDDNATPIVNGQVVSSEYVLQEGNTLTFEDGSSGKA